MTCARLSHLEPALGLNPRQGLQSEPMAGVPAVGRVGPAAFALQERLHILMAVFKNSHWIALSVTLL